MRAIAGEECDAARDRGETGYPAMWEADRVELIEDCVRWLAATSARTSSPARCRWSRSRRGSASGWPARSRGRCRRPSRSRSSCPRARCVCTGGSTGSTGTEARSRFRVVDYKTGERLRGEAPASCRAGGCCSCRCTCSRRRSCSGSTRPPARPRTSTRRARASSTSSTGRPRTSPPGTTTCIGAARRRSSPPRGAGTSSSRRRSGRVQLLPVQRHLPGARRRLRRAQGGRRAARPARDRDPEHPVSERLRDRAARERIAGELGSNLGVEAGAGTGKTTVLVERVTNAARERARRPSIELVVITFTEKAAAELSTRVRDALERRAGRAPRARSASGVLAAARDLYRCHIETIHSFAGRAAARAPGRGGDRPAVRGASTGSPAACRSTPPTRRSRTSCCPRASPELERALRRGFGLDEIREACELLNQYRYLRPLDIPAHDDGELATHLAEFRRIADELRRAARPTATPATTRGVEIAEGIIEWVDRLEALEHRGRAGVRAALPRPRADTHLSDGSKANWGEGKAAAEGAPAGVPRRARRRAGRAAHRRAAEPAAADRAVRRRLRAAAAQGRRAGLRRPAVLGARAAARRASRRATTSAAATGSC